MRGPLGPRGGLSACQCPEAADSGTGRSEGGAPTGVAGPLWGAHGPEQAQAGPTQVLREGPGPPGALGLALAKVGGAYKVPTPRYSLVTSSAVWVTFGSPVGHLSLTFA